LAIQLENWRGVGTGRLSPSYRRERQLSWSAMRYEFINHFFVNAEVKLDHPVSSTPK
jgi:hypothetical protein